MKRFSLLIIILSLMLSTTVQGAYEVTLDPDLDYYQTLSESGVTVPGPYIAAPTAENIRDWLIDAGLMDAAAALPLAAKDYHFDDDTIGTHYEDDTIGVHFDWDE